MEHILICVFLYAVVGVGEGTFQMSLFYVRPTGHAAFFNQSRTFVYDRSKGKFRDYLEVVIYLCALNMIRQRRKKEVDCEAVDLEACNNKRREEEQQHNPARALKQLKLQLEEIIVQAFGFYALKRESPEKWQNF